MKTLYVHKKTGTIQQYPVPVDLNNYYTATVADSFVYNIYTKYDPVSKAFSTVLNNQVNINAKLKEINAWVTTQLDSAVVEYNGYQFDADVKSRDTINATINAKYDVKTWTTKDNKKAQITFDDLVLILKSIVELHQRIHDRQREMKDSVLELTGSDVTNYKVQW